MLEFSRGAGAFCGPAPRRIGRPHATRKECLTTPRLLDSVREAVRTRHHGLRTEEAYVRWIREYILFFGNRHPSELGPRQTSAFASRLAVARNVSASIQNQALSALLFLYREVPAQPVG